jgi:4-hydroxy-tetrahydrodipicolinate synthase
MGDQEKLPNISGLMTALVTPFRNGDVDVGALGALVERQLESGVDWLVPLGTTGETPTLTRDERAEVLGVVIEKAGGRCPVMAGTGSNSTVATIELTQQAKAAGADAVLLVTPYYNRPPQEGLFRHFAAIADAVEIPMVLYNVPARTGVSLGNDVVVRLVKDYPHIVAIKDATGGLCLATDLLRRCRIAVLAGDDSLAWPFFSIGAVGVISVLSNLTPSLMKSLVDAARKKQQATARRLHAKVHALSEELGRFGPNPIPIKTAMAVAGMIEEEFRLPLCGVDATARTGIEDILRRHECVEAVPA